MDGKVDTSKAHRVARSMSWVMLFVGIGLLIWNLLSAGFDRTNHHDYPANTSMALWLITSSLQGIVTNLRWQLVFLALQVPILIVMFRFLMLDLNS